ncbi:MAG TPA: hypothetical protein VM223_12300, partial [Planctomycetota bacterium]|nr:hypothetical protein [Planctomycetota bacterium]
LFLVLCSSSSHPASSFDQGERRKRKKQKGKEGRGKREQGTENKEQGTRRRKTADIVKGLS